MRASRGAKPETRRSSPARPSRSIRTTASSPGTSSMCPANRSISTKCSSACWSTAADRSCCSRSARPASYGSSTARHVSSSASRKPSSRTSFRASIRETGEPTYRSDILEQEVGQWIQACPSTEGGHNWQAMSYHPGTDQLIIPLSQSCMEMMGRNSRIQGRLGRQLPGSGASTRCRASTAISASSRPTM